MNGSPTDRKSGIWIPDNQRMQLEERRMNKIEYHSVSTFISKTYCNPLFRSVYLISQHWRRRKLSISKRFLLSRLNILQIVCEQKRFFEYLVISIVAHFIIFLRRQVFIIELKTTTHESQLDSLSCRKDVALVNLVILKGCYILTTECIITVHRYSYVNKSARDIGTPSKKKTLLAQLSVSLCKK